MIHLHLHARAKPSWGEPCNGCGVCCASEPCPVGMLISRRRTGACAALSWSDADRLYRCGLLTAPASHLPRALRWCAPWLGRWARRWISAGSGCDCDYAVRPHGAAGR